MSSLREQDALMYRMPAEWERQERIWFSWPSAKHLWPKNLPAVQDEILRVIAEISQYDRVGLNGFGLASEAFEKRLYETPNLRRDNLLLSDIPNDDAWCRDHGPTFVESKSEEATTIGIDWNFDAWGGKFEQCEDDHLVARRMLEHLEIPRVECPFIGEGGGIEVNGQGALMLSKSVWLNPNRNASCKQKDLEVWLKQYLGCELVHWFEEGLADDDTDGHVDMFARYVADTAIVVCREKRTNHPQYRALQQIREELEGFHTLTRGHYDVIELPMPEPVYDSEGNACPASYGNFLIFNDFVWVPQYGQERTDAYAIGILQECFPNHRVLGVDCSKFILEGGAIHCLTQQQPAIKRSATKDEADPDPFAHLLI